MHLYKKNILVNHKMVLLLTTQTSPFLVHFKVFPVIYLKMSCGMMAIGKIIAGNNTFLLKKDSGCLHLCIADIIIISFYKVSVAIACL